MASDTAKYDIDIPHDNPRVLAFVQLFTTGLKNYLQDGLSRGARFLPMIRQVFQEEGVPLDLAYVPLVESAFKVNAFSRTKAKGLWQFMQATGRENGLRTDWYIDERSEPEKATRAAAKYLKTLYGMFSDWSLALASYNAGPGTVQNAIKRSHGVRDFWELAANRRNFRQETRDYVPLIMAATIIAKNPVQYGLDVPAAQEDPRFETVRVSSVVDLRRVAEWADVPVEAIQVLNPELRRWTTPVRADEYVLRVPEGKADLVSQRLADAADETSLNWHTVRKGETLASDRKSTRLNSSHTDISRMPSSA